jgi:hypothetical protein
VRHDPEPQAEAEQCRGWEHVLALAPDRAELMHWVADCTYHFGAVFGDDDHMAKARRLFERAFAADPSFMPSLEHLIEITATQQDTIALRRYAEMHLAADSASERRDFVRWLLAHATADTLTLHSIAQRYANYLALRDREDDVGRVASQPVRDALARLTRDRTRN